MTLRHSRDAGEDEGGGLNDWNYLNELNSPIGRYIIIFQLSFELSEPLHRTCKVCLRNA
jgi:hypothetical protein